MTQDHYLEVWITNEETLALSCPVCGAWVDTNEGTIILSRLNQWESLHRLEFAHLQQPDGAIPYG